MALPHLRKRLGHRPDFRRPISWGTERTHQVVLDSIGLNCDMVQPAVATSKLEMAKFSLTFLTFGEYIVVASTKLIAGDAWV